MQAAAAAPAAAPHTGSNRGGAAAAAVTAHAAATLAWLADHHNMEARVVEQVVSLRPRVMAATGSGIFAGQAHCAVARCDVLPRCLLAPCVWASRLSTGQRLGTCHSSAPRNTAGSALLLQASQSSLGGCWPSCQTPCLQQQTSARLPWQHLGSPWQPCSRCSQLHQSLLLMHCWTGQHQGLGCMVVLYLSESSGGCSSITAAPCWLAARGTSLHHAR